MNERDRENLKEELRRLRDQVRFAAEARVDIASLPETDEVTYE